MCLPHPAGSHFGTRCRAQRSAQAPQCLHRPLETLCIARFEPKIERIIPNVVVPAQTLVFSSSLGGTFNPSNVTFTGGFGVSTTFTAPTGLLSQATTITVLGSNGVPLGQAQVSIICAGLTPTPIVPASLSVLAQGGLSLCLECHEPLGRRFQDRYL